MSKSVSKKPSNSVPINQPPDYLKGRESDVNLINYKPTYGNPTNTTFKDMFTNIGQQYNFSPQLLFASSAEEGLRDAIKTQGWSGNKDFPIPGAEYFGMDYFGGDYQKLVNKGLLPADFKQNFVPKNYTLPKEEGGGVRPSADFKTFQDALTAQAAMLADRRSGVDEEAKKQGITLSPAARDFFTLVNYNASNKTMPMMMSDYNKAGYLEGDAFLKERPTKGKNGVNLSDKSYADVYDHVQRRIKPAEAWKSYFENNTTTQQQNNNSSPATKMPSKFVATVNGKQVSIEKDNTGRYTYVNDDGDIVEYKTK